MGQIILFLSDMIIPLTFVGILVYAFSKKVPVYDRFIEGAKEGFHTVLHIAPTIVGIIVSKKKCIISTKNKTYK